MSTFDIQEQVDCRVTFIKECKQKAWGAACHADYISKQLDEVMAEYQKLQAEDRKLEEAIKASEAAIDFHTVENRQKRDGMRNRRDTLAKMIAGIAANIQQGNRAIAELHRSVESNLALAKHAEEWGWKEVEAGLENAATEASS